MKSSFRESSVKTAFLFRSDLSLTNSFSALLNTLPQGKTNSINALNKYKEKISTQSYRGSYKRTIFGIIDRLIDTIASSGASVHSFTTIQLTTNIKLTVNTLYQDYLNGLNDGTDIDPVMIMILNEIKSASIS